LDELDILNLQVSESACRLDFQDYKESVCISLGK